MAQKAAPSSEEVVVSGSLLRQSGTAPREAELSAGTPVRVVYGRFLARLQAAVKANDRAALVSMVGLPLRVNYSGGAQTYRDRAAVERDFGRIFTARVKRAVLRQKPGKLFVRDLGAIVGDGELWFSEGTGGDVRITAVNP
jgi:hypothetical protein